MKLNPLALNRIIMRRGNLGLWKLARAMHVSCEHLRDLFAGTSEATPAEVQRMATLLDVPVSAIVVDENAQSKPTTVTPRS
jgi:plasmid maintenance system antidote protein VapI